MRTSVLSAAFGRFFFVYYVAEGRELLDENTYHSNNRATSSPNRGL